MHVEPTRRGRHVLDAFLHREAPLRTYPPPGGKPAHCGLRGHRVSQFESVSRAELTAHIERSCSANVTGSLTDTLESERPPGDRAVGNPNPSGKPKSSLEAVWRQKLMALPPDVAGEALKQLSAAPTPAEHRPADCGDAPEQAATPQTHPGDAQSSQSPQAAPAAPPPAGRKLLLLSRERTHGGRVEPGVLREVELPPENSLLNPAQRREVHRAELEAQQASAALAQARRQHNRLTLIARSRHPHGVLGCEAPETDGGSVYQAEKDRRDRLEQQRMRERKARQDFQVNSETKKGSGGAKIMHHASAGEEGCYHDGSGTFMQAKKRAPRPADGLSFVKMTADEPTQVSETKFNKHMYAHEGRGRTYNIVSGSALLQVATNPYE